MEVICPSGGVLFHLFAALAMSVGWFDGSLDDDRSFDRLALSRARSQRFDVAT